MEGSSWNDSDLQDIIALIDVLLEKADYHSRCLHQHQKALELLERVKRLVKQGGALVPAVCRMQEAAILEHQGQKAEAARHYDEVLEMLSGTRNKATLTACLEGLGRCQKAQGHTEAALAHLMQALHLSLERKDTMTEERLRRYLGQLAEEKHYIHAAQFWYSSALALAHKEENWAGVISDLTQLVALTAKLQHYREQERLEKERSQLLDELGELAYVGPSAAPRMQVIDAARNLLYSEGLKFPDSTLNNDYESIAQELYHQATDLRKSNCYQEALPLYRYAIACYENLDQPANISACLNGLGLSYSALAKKAFRQNLTTSKECTPPLSVFSLISLYKQSLQGQPLNLVKQARACHLWSLELHKLMNNLAGQASQISNLALIEELLGNLDTARHYQLWAVKAHEKAGQSAATRIDLTHLAALEHMLGDEEAVTVWQGRLQEVSSGTRT